MMNEVGVPALPERNPQRQAFRRWRGFGAVGLVAFLLMLPGLTSCRSASGGGIVVTVTNPANQPVTHAIVTVLNPQTNTSIGARSDRPGEYRTPSLPGGTYTVVIQKEGFQPEMKTNVRAGASSRVRIGVRLSPVTRPAGAPPAGR